MFSIHSQPESTSFERAIQLYRGTSIGAPSMIALAGASYALWRSSESHIMRRVVIAGGTALLSAFFVLNSRSEPALIEQPAVVDISPEIPQGLTFLEGSHPEHGITIQKDKADGLLYVNFSSGPRVVLPKGTEYAWNELTSTNTKEKAIDCGLFVAYAMELDKVRRKLGYTEPLSSDRFTPPGRAIEMVCKVTPLSAGMTLPDGAFFAMDGERRPQNVIEYLHYGIYLGNGLTLSKLGLGGPFAICSMDDLQRLYGPDLLLLEYNYEERDKEHRSRSC